MTRCLTKYATECVAIVDKKIAALDNELRKYKEQLTKANKVQAQHIKKRAMDVLKRKVGPHLPP